jgi:hypothetical protein
MLVLYTDTHTFTHLCVCVCVCVLVGVTYTQKCVCVFTRTRVCNTHSHRQISIDTHTKNTHKEGAYFIRVWGCAKNGGGGGRGEVDLWVLPTVLACTPKLN